MFDIVIDAAIMLLGFTAVIILGAWVLHENP